MPTPLYKKYCALPIEMKSRMSAQLGPLEEATAFDLPQDKFTHYACTDPVVTRRIQDIFLPQIHSMGLDKVMAIDHAIIPMVADMMSRGMLIDQQHFKNVKEVLVSLMDEKAIEIKGMFPGLIDNPGSDDEVAQLLFSHLHLKYLYLTDSGKRPSVDKETLDTLEDAHPVVPHISAWRELETLLTTFAGPLLKRVQSSVDGRIHPNILLTRQPTGRLSTKQPNLLAIPTRTQMGKLIREGFIPTPGYSFLSCDFSQLEARILAHLSKDETLCEVFKSGVDPFKATAATLWGIPVSSVTKEARDVTKTVFYLIIYGGSAEGLSVRLIGQGLTEWTVTKVTDFINGFFKLYPGVPIFISQCHAEARATGMIHDMFGRYKYAPQVRSTKKHVREEGLRQVQNFPMQSSASGIMKLAMKMVWDWMQTIPPQEYWVDLQIHDELLGETIQGEEEEMGKQVSGIMEGAIELRVPLKAKYCWSPLSWGRVPK